MKNKSVLKYNAFKGVSTLLTVGTPLITLACCGDMFIHRSETAISAAGVFALLIAALFFKDKIAEKFKSPSALVISIAVLILCALIENIILPIKYVCIATIAASGIDELTFKAWYKKVERSFPVCIDDYKHVGFVFTSTQKLIEESNDNVSRT